MRATFNIIDDIESPIGLRYYKSYEAALYNQGFTMSWNYTGKRYEWWPDGHKCLEENYVNGSKHGGKRVWYKTGQQHYKENYVNGRLHGKQYGYHMNNVVASEENFIDGEYDGKQYV